MYHIICEDKGSGFQFFKYIADIYSNNSYNIVSSDGNQNFLDKLSEVADILKSGDRLLLAFDNIGVMNKFNPKEIVSKAHKICSKKKVGLWHTKYYCFEEVYLSYSEFFRLCQYHSNDKSELKQYISVLDFVRKSIMSQEDYYDKDNPLINDFIAHIKRAGENREHFCDALLENTSRWVRGNVTICKGSFGECWLRSCDDAKVKNKEYTCNNLCNFCMRRNRADEKLSHLENNSLSVLYLPYSDFFK